MTSNLFHKYGKLCTQYPWEVIFATVTMTTCLLSIEKHDVNDDENEKQHMHHHTVEPHAATIIIMTLIRSIAILYSYYQFRNLKKLNSKYILIISGLFTVLSSFVFTTTLINILGIELYELKDALFFFLLLIDLSKTSALAQFALSSDSEPDLKRNIAKGMEVLGPTITLDMIVETLLLSVGTLSGVQRLEMLSYFACLSVLINYIIFMTFYPACLYLILELSRFGTKQTPLFTSLVKQDHKMNPVVQRVKIIMSFGLFLVHLHSRWISTNHSKMGNSPVGAFDPEQIATTDVTAFNEYLLKWIAMSCDQIVILILVLALTVKFVFFDDEPMAELRRSNDLFVENFKHKQIQTKPFEFDLHLEKSSSNANKIESIAKLQNPELKLIVNKAILKNDQNSISQQECMNNFENNVYNEDELELRLRLKQSQFNDEINLKNLINIIYNILSEDKIFVRNNGEYQISKIPNINVRIYNKNEYPRNEMFTQENQKVQITANNPVQSDPNLNKIADINKSIVKLETNKDGSVTSTRDITECIRIYKEEQSIRNLSDEEILMLIPGKHIPAHQLEKLTGNPLRGVTLRRKLNSTMLNLSNLPYENYDYNKVFGTCCENVVGYVPVPVGIVGPLLLDGCKITVPMATTEGCLVASTNRGCRALVHGVTSRIVADGMTRGPVLRFPTLEQSSKALRWFETNENFNCLKLEFDATSNYARLQRIQIKIAGRLLYARFVATTGDAMGMNMVSKGTEQCLAMVQTHFPQMEVLSLSGNYCADKKATALNWIEGRGKSVVCEAIVPQHVIENVLKTTVEALVDVNISKNLVGSSLAGSLGGNNAHAANIVTAIFIATGQDPAQNITSSNCMTLMESAGQNNRDLYISCTMPSLEVGTVGGGTTLNAQSCCLNMMGVQGPNCVKPGANARQLARNICATVLAGELSLMAALASGHLVRSHLAMNRQTKN